MGKAVWGSQGQGTGRVRASTVRSVHTLHPFDLILPLWHRYFYLHLINEEIDALKICSSPWVMLQGRTSFHLTSGSEIRVSFPHKAVLMYTP